MATKHNTRSSATKRILQEHREFLADPSSEFVAYPLEQDIFEWHVTVRGVENSEYAGGIYHLRILLKTQYPMQAPDILIMTPQGRFEPNRKICIDGLTSFHEGSWRPAWGVRTAIVGLMSFWSQGGEAMAGVGAMNCDKDERKRLAKLSVNWTCPVCQKSNGEIMREHEESMDVSKVEKFKNKGLESGCVPHDDGQADKQASEISAGVTVGSQDMSSTQVTTTTTLNVLPDPTPTGPTTFTTRQHLTQQPAAAEPPFITRTLLKPPPSTLALAPLRLAHYHLCNLFCPTQYRQHHMPARPDSVVYLDTLIMGIITVLAVVILHKLARSWSRIVYVVLVAVEKASGIDMSWITQRFSPANANANANAAGASSAGARYHWMTGVDDHVGGGGGGGRTRLRNMDTAMRAREIARRFPAWEAGARAGGPERGGGPRRRAAAADL
ncbi:hypothetical protein QFC21_002129 [Naganishia friedmannii]|uniref:Uncharacterized protein n=1 Tax=Naganishia friedmannii TaxID=89922 RepID=A0ACC2VZV6_9TREE|nr:hypothetical protein QFC21_002129 [Naganishia friedmannii]